jgi:hypothetical protein
MRKKKAGVYRQPGGFASKRYFPEIRANSGDKDSLLDEESIGEWRECVKRKGEF